MIDTATQVNTSVMLVLMTERGIDLASFDTRVIFIIFFFCESRPMCGKVKGANTDNTHAHTERHDIASLHFL